MVKHRSRRTSRLKLTESRWLILSVVLILIAGGGLAWARYSGDDSSSTSTESSGAGSTENSQDINLSPATDQERSETEAHKQDLGNQQSSTSSSSGKKQVTPIITSASKTEARAYVQGVFEDGGTCTATFVHGQDKVATSSKGFKNVSYISCEPMTLPGPLNIKGNWTVTVSYGSATAEGKSATETINVE